MSNEAEFFLTTFAGFAFFGFIILFIMWTLGKVASPWAPRYKVEINDLQEMRLKRRFFIFLFYCDVRTKKDGSIKEVRWAFEEYLADRTKDKEELKQWMRFDIEAEKEQRARRNWR